MEQLILSVDDEPLFSELLRKILASAKVASVEHAPDNAAALSAISRRRPSLVISDIVHPGPSGLELFAALRSDPKTASIPFVFLSRQVARQPELELDLFRRGAEGVLAKPFRIEDLISCVKRILREPLSPDVDLLLLGFESRDLDYKEDVDLESKVGRASLAKDALALANVGGGSIVIGVREQTPGVFERVGLTEERLASLETTKINDSLRPYLGPAVSLSARTIEYRARRFVILRVQSSGDTLAMAAQSHERAGLFTGRIYSRSDAARTEEVRDSLELLRLLERVVAERVRRHLVDRDH